MTFAHMLATTTDLLLPLAAETEGTGVNIPNPSPVAPPGTAKFFADWISYTKYVGIIAGILGLMACGIMMAIGRRNRGNLAAEGASGLVWALAGLSVILLAVGIVSAMTNSMGAA